MNFKIDPKNSVHKTLNILKQKMCPTKILNRLILKKRNHVFNPFKNTIRNNNSYLNVQDV